MENTQYKLPEAAVDHVYRTPVLICFNDKKEINSIDVGLCHRFLRFGKYVSD